MEENSLQLHNFLLNLVHSIILICKVLDKNYMINHISFYPVSNKKKTSKPSAIPPCKIEKLKLNFISFKKTNIHIVFLQSTLGLHRSLSPCSITPCCYAVGIKYVKPHLMLFYFENTCFLHLSAPEELDLFLIYTKKRNKRKCNLSPRFKIQQWMTARFLPQ